MPDAPLLDPDYEPKYPPVNRRVPDIVALWGPESQLRWFNRFRGQFDPMRTEEWNRFYCSTVQHRGLCCDSCLDDRDAGYDLDESYCCCESLRATGE